MEKHDFLQLMGKGKRCWKYVKTKDDLNHLKEFEDLFIRNYQKVPNGNELLIPETLHFVWLGPKEYPEQSRKYLEGWIERHPSWKVIFWSDREHLFLPEKVEKKFVSLLLLGKYQRLYDGSDNFGERSDLIRLLALEELGGVYIDHDMECRSNFAPLHRVYSFYGGLLTPGNPVIHRSAIVRNSIIGAGMGHPIIKRALTIAEENWDLVKEKYPGKDITSIKKRVTLHLFAAFHNAVLEAIKDPNFKGIIFPAGCFNEIERDFGIMAKEDMVGSWYTEEMTHHEQYLKDRLHKIMKRMHFLIGLLATSILILSVLVILLWMRAF